MKLLISTGSFLEFKLSHFEILNISKQIGFDGVELFLGDEDDLNKIDFEKLKKYSEQISLPIYNLHFPSYEKYLLKYLLSQGTIAKKIIPQSFKLAEKLQVENFVIHPLPTLYLFDLFKKMMENILSELPRSINISLEIMPSVQLGPIKVLPHILKYPEDFCVFCKKNKVYMTLDITHCKNISISPEDAFITCSDIITNIHISDFKRHSQHLPIGWGEIDFAHFFETLKKINYNKFVTLELVSEYFDDIKIIEQSYKKCREFLR